MSTNIKKSIVAIITLMIVLVVVLVALTKSLGPIAVLNPVVVLALVFAVLPMSLNPARISLSAEIRSRLADTTLELPQGFVNYELTGSDCSRVVVLINGFSIPYYVWDYTFEALKSS